MAVAAAGHLRAQRPRTRHAILGLQPARERRGVRWAGREKASRRPRAQAPTPGLHSGTRRSGSEHLLVGASTPQSGALLSSISDFCI